MVAGDVLEARILKSMKNGFWKPGMNTVIGAEPKAVGVVVSDDRITATLQDGRTISVPLSWSWRLEKASATERSNYQLIGGGIGFHWPDVDEDISVEGMLNGSPAPRPTE